MMDLNQLLQSARAQVKAAEAEKTGKERVKVAKTSKERQEAMEQLARLRDKIDWVPKFLVFCTTRWTCACGEHGDTPHGLFILQEHGRLANTVRLVATKNTPFDVLLPRRLHVTKELYSRCLSCSWEEGFDTEYAPDRHIPIAHGAGFVAEWRARTAPEPEQEAPDDNEG